MAGWAVHHDSDHTVVLVLVVDIVVRIEFEVDRRLVVGREGFVVGHKGGFVPDSRIDCLNTEGIPVVLVADHREDSPADLLGCSIDLQT